MLIGYFKYLLSKVDDDVIFYLFHEDDSGGIPLYGIIQDGENIYLVDENQAKNTKDKVIPTLTKLDLLCALDDICSGRVCFFKNKKDVVFVCVTSYKDVVWFEAYDEKNSQNDSFMQFMSKHNSVDDFARYLDMLGVPSGVIRRYCKKLCVNQ